MEHFLRRASAAIVLLIVILASSGCGGGGGTTVPASAIASITTPSGAGQAALPAGTRSGFLGAFFRPEGPPPFGIFAGQAAVAPQPYPTPGSVLVGPSGYCDRVAANGVSIASVYPVDVTKLADIVNLGVRWIRMPAPQFTDDESHVFGSGQYAFGDFDSAQCSTLAEHGMRPVIGLEAGPVQYSAILGQLPALSVPQYRTASDFGQWCGAVAAHERSVFPAVSRFSLPGNEVNSNPQLFPGGDVQLAAYSEACYAAIKSANPNAFVYAFELNMDGALNAAGFVRDMFALGCKVGTCYDGVAMHLSLRYPIPGPATPCYPNPGGDYSMQCITDIQNAAQNPIHVLISETVYAVPADVPDEATKALAVTAELSAFAGNLSVDGTSYSDVDECALYPTGAFANGCLVNTSGQLLPAYKALQGLAGAYYQ